MTINKKWGIYLVIYYKIYFCEKIVKTEGENMKKYIKINKNDNVAIILEPMKKGEVITDGDKNTVLAEDIDKGHKTALADIKVGENVIKYGMPIGKAVKDIAAGEWIHTHNVKTNLSDLNNYEYNPKFQEHSIKIPEKKINAYRRKKYR